MRNDVIDSDIPVDIVPIVEPPSAIVDIEDDEAEKDEVEDGLEDDDLEDPDDDDDEDDDEEPEL